MSNFLKQKIADLRKQIDQHQKSYLELAEENVRLRVQIEQLKTTLETKEKNRKRKIISSGKSVYSLKTDTAYGIVYT